MFRLPGTVKPINPTNERALRFLLQRFFLLICQFPKCKMKLLVFALLALSLTACKKSTLPFQSNGSLMGVDLRDCPCCGGYIIQIDGVVNPAGYFRAGT